MIGEPIPIQIHQARHLNQRLPVGRTKVAPEELVPHGFGEKERRRANLGCELTGVIVAEHFPHVGFARVTVHSINVAVAIDVEYALGLSYG